MSDELGNFSSSTFPFPQVKKERTEVILWGRRYLVKKVTRDGTHLVFEDEETGEPERLGPQRFWALYEAGDLEVDDDTFDRLPIRFRDTLDRSIEPSIDKHGWDAYRRFKYCVAADDVPDVSKTANGLGPIIKSVANKIGDLDPPNHKTLTTWLRERGVPGKRLACFMQSQDHKKGRSNWLGDEVDLIVETTIEAYFKNQNELRPKEIVEAVYGEIALRNRALRKSYEISDEAYDGMSNAERSELGFLIEPWSTTILRRLEKHEGYSTSRSRTSKREADKLYRGVGRAPKATRVNEVWYIDHTKLDSHLVYNRKRRLPLGRPWLTVVVDAYSRLIVGFFISFIPPSIHSLSLALKNAISAKTYVLNKFPEIDRTWQAMGLPRKIVCDRALEFTGHSFELACAELGIEVVWCPRKAPWWKGIVERTIGTINTDFVELLPGATKGDARKLTKRDRNPILEARIDYAELDAQFHKWVILVYPRKFHTGLGDRPGVVYERGIRENPPVMLRRASDLGVLGMTFERTLTRDGIHYLYLVFGDKKKIFEILDRAGTPKIKVRFTIDPANPRLVTVRDPTTNERIDLPCRTPERVEDLSLWEYANVAKYMRSKNYDLSDRERWLIAKKEIRDALMAHLLKRGNKISKNTTVARRLNFGGQGHVGTVVLNQLIDGESDWLQLEFAEAEVCDPDARLSQDAERGRDTITRRAIGGTSVDEPGTKMGQFGRRPPKRPNKMPATQKPSDQIEDPAARVLGDTQSINKEEVGESGAEDDDSEFLLAKFSVPKLSPL